MRLRTRVAVAATLAVLVTVTGVSVAVYLSIGRELRRQVDVTLQEQGDRLAAGPTARPLPPADLPMPEDPPNPNGSFESGVFADSYVQTLDADGQVVSWLGEGRLPESAVATEVATGTRPSTFEEVTVGADHVRVYTVATANGALRFGRSLDEVERSLERLTVAMVAASLVGVAVAAFLGRFLAARAIAPVHDLSDEARAIKETGDLSRRLPVHGHDEVASMAESFNEVLDDLEASLALQRQLVADASHELRTPLATLRTNIEVLARGHELADDERERILHDLTEQLHDLGELVGDLVDLARDVDSRTAVEAVRLDEVVHEVVDRARRQRPNLTYTVVAVPCTVDAWPDRLDRAVSNLVDNAGKWSPPDGEVTITVGGGTLTVQDEGPGIDPTDLPHIFDRFYRAASARRVPGSGLGLAIVKQVADSLGGHVEARSTPGRGTTLRLHLRPSAGTPTR